MFWSSLFASPLARLCGVPVVVETLHGTEAWRKGWKASNLIDRATTGLVSRYVAVCESDARFLTEKKGVPAKKITVIHNGIETHRFHSLQGARSAIRNSIGATESHIVLIVVARLHSGKGHRVLLQALHLLTRIHPNLRLVCVGEGEEEAELKNLCHAFALESHVKWMGHQSNIPEWLAAADINVLPTHYEGLPLTILEAMAAGLPTVASAVGGIPDAIESGVSGLLVPPGEPGALASALSTLIRSAATRARMADAARARVTLHFDLSQQVRNTENMYLELCRALSAPRAIRTPSPQSSEAEKAAIPATVD